MISPGKRAALVVAVLLGLVVVSAVWARRGSSPPPPGEKRETESKKEPEKKPDPLQLENARLKEENATLHADLDQKRQSQPSATIGEVKDYADGKDADGRPALEIHLKDIEISNLENVEVAAVVYFRHEDGTRLENPDPVFSSSQGAARCVLFRTIANPHRMQEVVIVMPYDELTRTLSRGIHRLRYHVALRQVNGGASAILIEAEGRSFTLKVG